MGKNGALFNSPEVSKLQSNNKLEERYRTMETQSDDELMGKPELPKLNMEELKQTKFSGKSGMQEMDVVSNYTSTTPNPGMNAETFYLPSKNLLYGEDFDGHFNMRMFTTKEERLRVSNRDTFLQTMCSILNNCITTNNGVKIDTKWFTEFDFIYVMYMSRIISYGNKYNIESVCPSCYEPFKYSVNLDELKINYLEDEFIEPIVIESLPSSKDKLELRFLRVIDRMQIDKESAEIKIQNPNYEGNPAFNLKYEYSIQKVNGEELSKFDKRQYVENLPALDIQYIDYILGKTKAGIDTEIDIVCPNCGRIHKHSLSINSTFFRPGFSN